ncbi:hypothetical protein ISCGN_010522 [Ixodes scapularis]
MKEICCFQDVQSMRAGSVHWNDPTISRAARRKWCQQEALWEFPESSAIVLLDFSVIIIISSRQQHFHFGQQIVAVYALCCSRSLQIKMNLKQYSKTTVEVSARPQPMAPFTSLRSHWLACDDQAPICGTRSAHPPPHGAACPSAPVSAPTAKVDSLSCLFVFNVPPCLL